MYRYVLYKVSKLVPVFVKFSLDIDISIDIDIFDIIEGYGENSLCLAKSKYF